MKTYGTIADLVARLGLEAAAFQRAVRRIKKAQRRRHK